MYVSNSTYTMPKEVVDGFVSLGYNKEDIEDVSNIDSGLYCLDKNTGKEVVSYALYYDEDIHSDDVIEVTIDSNDWFIEENGHTIARGSCYYDISVEDEKPIGELYIVTT